MAMLGRSWQLTCLTSSYASTLSPAVGGRPTLHRKCTHTEVQSYYSDAATTSSEENSEHLSESPVNYTDASIKTGSTEGSNRSKNHMYNSIYSWRTVSELANQLLATKIYEDNHILVVNKPYGVSQTYVASPDTQKRVYGAHPLVPRVTIEKVLPVLKEIIETKRLELVFSPEKWNSGVMIFSKSDIGARAVKFGVRMGREQHRSRGSYWVITKDVPRPSTQILRQCAITQDSKSELGPLLVLSPASNRIKTREQRPFFVQHSTLATSDDTQAALVQVEVSSTKNNSLRVWLSHCMAVPLGDHLFSSRVSYLMGRPVHVPLVRAAARQQPLSYDFLGKIDLLPSLESLIPLCIHLRSVTLPEYFKIVENAEKKRGHNRSVKSTAQLQNNGLQSGSNFDITDDVLTLRASLPKHFSWTLDKLKITGFEKTIKPQE